MQCKTVAVTACVGLGLGFVVLLLYYLVLFQQARGEGLGLWLHSHIAVAGSTTGACTAQSGRHPLMATSMISQLAELFQSIRVPARAWRRVVDAGCRQRVVASVKFSPSAGSAGYTLCKCRRRPSWCSSGAQCLAPPHVLVDCSPIATPLTAPSLATPLTSPSAPPPPPSSPFQKAGPPDSGQTQRPCLAPCWWSACHPPPRGSPPSCVRTVEGGDMWSGRWEGHLFF